MGYKSLCVLFADPMPELHHTCSKASRNLLLSFVEMEDGKMDHFAVTEMSISCCSGTWTDSWFRPAWTPMENWSMWVVPDTLLSSAVWACWPMHSLLGQEYSCHLRCNSLKIRSSKEMHHLLSRATLKKNKRQIMGEKWDFNNLFYLQITCI